MNEKPFSFVSGASNDRLIEKILQHAEGEFGNIVDTYRGTLHEAVHRAIVDGKSGWEAAKRTCQRIVERQSIYRKIRTGQKKVYGVQYGAKRRRARKWKHD